MKTKKSNLNTLYIVISCIMSILIVISAIFMMESSYVEVTTDTGTYSTYVAYGDKIGASYEDSEMFADAFRNEMMDITKLSVIRSQMETGGKYDANKKIDISAYANRKKVFNVADANVIYRLDDLIKWGNYGFDYQVVYGTGAQLDAYFSNSKGNENIASVSATDTIHLSNLDNFYNYNDGYTLEELVRNSAYIDLPEKYTENGEKLQTMFVLMDRYSTADGKKLIDYAANRSEYESLVKNLSVSANDLFLNFTEYSDLMERYAGGKTNILYCYQLNDNSGKIVRYDNLNQNVALMTNDDLSKVFTGFKKYVCFNPDKMQITTNINQIDAVEMKQTLSSYDYAFGDGTGVWVAIDGDYPATDIFSAGQIAYSKSGNLFIPAAIVLVISSIILLIMIVLMTIMAGRVTVVYEDGETNTVTKPISWDNMPIEIYCILVGIICCLLFGLAALSTHIIFDARIVPIFSGLTYVTFGSVAGISAAILLPLYLILVRKLKCRLIWNSSITKKIFDNIREMLIDAYDNGQLIVRTWLPFLLFLAFNLVMVLLGAGGIFIAFVLDMVLGVWLYREAKVREGIVDGITAISGGDLTHQIDTAGMHGDNLALAGAVNSIGDGIRIAVEKSMKDEKMKADLITNVSHDIKTPLTSIINFVDLLKRENIEDEKIKGYIDVLDKKSQKLKALTNDLVEASKISSGNITLNIEKIDMAMLINQSVGEFMEKFEEKQLTPILRLPNTPVYVMADSRGIYRVVDNLYNNIYKYALPGTRIYVDMESTDGKMTVSFKNISAEPLNIDTSELTERFIRGDASRKTEGSGLGLSIAKSLTEAQKGSFDISLDGDLFKVIIGFNLA